MRRKPPSLPSMRIVTLIAALATTSASPCACGQATHAAAVHATPPTQIPALREDEIILLNTRPLGTRCDPALMAEGVYCETFVSTRWARLTWDNVLELARIPAPTVVYVHGNRVARGEDRAAGLSVYRSIRKRVSPSVPIRYVIWSWPSTPVRGLLKDYRVKAARTEPVGWQLAWAVDQLPPETPLSLVGYSYGARVVSGALHLLAGGALGGLQLPAAPDHVRPKVTAAYIAAALDASWLSPGGPHGKSLQQIDRLILVNNRRDPAMRFYHLAAESRRARALGYAGPIGVSASSLRLARVVAVDASETVGRSHALERYLAAAPHQRQVWREIAHATPLPPYVDAVPTSTVADRHETAKQK
ncbi:MAG: hypothetical protein AAF961_08360 [Planctomycetota bacterium]